MSKEIGLQSEGQFWSRKFHDADLHWLGSAQSVIFYFLCYNCKNKRSPNAWLFKYPACCWKQEGVLGGQFFSVILALGLIFQIRDFEDSVSIIWSILHATLSAGMLILGILFAKLDFCPANLLLKERFWINDFLMYSFVWLRSHFNFFINWRILGLNGENHSLQEPQTWFIDGKGVFGTTNSKYSFQLPTLQRRDFGCGNTEYNEKRKC